MPYIEGFVAAVPTANRATYIEHAKQGAEYFKKLGATRVTECWGDDVPRGEVTDFFRATQAKDDETVIFSWIEYPDRATRDAANEKIGHESRSGVGFSAHVIVAGAQTRVPSTSRSRLIPATWSSW